MKTNDLQYFVKCLEGTVNISFGKASLKTNLHQRVHFTKLSKALSYKKKQKHNVKLPSNNVLYVYRKYIKQIVTNH